MKQIGSIAKIRKFDVTSSEMLAVSPHCHGQFATCGDW
jgi:hypothetical protein